MSAQSVVSELAVVSIVVRWTAVLGLAWLAHLALVGRNPRWRVALWRGAVVGVAGVAVLTLAPRVLLVPVIPAATAGLAASDLTPPSLRLNDPGPGPSAPVFRRQHAGPPSAQSASAAGSPAAPAWRVVPALLALWMAGVAVLAARLALAWRGLRRIIARSEDVPAHVVEQCCAVAKALSAPAARVVCSAEIATPCIAGFRHPVLLLPARAPVDDLRGVFAHELAHAQGHDLAWNLLAHGATIVLWFHPLAWRLRSAHAAACDAVCDAVAADFLGDVSAYSRTLARLALVALGPSPAPGLAMAHSSDIRRRVDALNRNVFHSRLPRKLALPAAIGGLVLLILIGGLAVTGAAPPPSTEQSAQPAPAADGRLEIQAVADATGKPLEGTTVVSQLRINGGRFTKTTSTTGPDGRASLEWSKGATVNTLWLTARKPGFVPYTIHLDDRSHPLRLPAVKVLRFVPGITIGGVVRDEAGTPVAGAKITAHAPPTEKESSGYSVPFAETTTDAQGRWRVDDAPVDLIGVNVGVEAPRFLRGGGPPSRDEGAVIVLKRGFTVKGRVLDPQGKPLAGASVSVGGDFSSRRETKSDASGTFVLENCEPGASLVTVRAERFAPDLREIHPEDHPTLQFRLGAGHTLLAKVVDGQGNPVAGATLAAETWRSHHRSLHFRVTSGNDGRLEWRAAPGDVVLYSLWKPGYMSRRQVSLAPDVAEQTLTLDPALVISGSVTDASTREPVPSFRLVRGLKFSNNPRIIWMVQDSAEFTGGRYTIKHDEPYEGYAIRIEATGYKPADSRVFKPTEGTTSFDFALTRAAPTDFLTGTVLRPDGRPAAGAEVALATPAHPLVFEMQQVRFSRSNGMSFAKTGPDGRFTFDAPDGPFLLAAMSDDGYAELHGKPGNLTLEAWGKVKGQAFIGRNPAANQPVSIGPRDYRPVQNGVNAFYESYTRTDAHGRFVFDRAIPGPSQVARVVVTEFGNGSTQQMGCWQQPVDVQPGETVEVKIGGKGRPVVGQVLLKAAPGVNVDWRRNRPATIERARGFNLLPGARQNDRFAASLDKDGRFRIDDVPPGHYELTVTIDAPPELDRPGPVNEFGRVRVPVDVPEGDSDVPVDLGEIAATVEKPR
jgi:beta-lactamase regulating signal transducer with metallopeptidase domain